MTEEEPKTPPDNIKSCTTGKIYPLTAEGLDKMLKDNQKWRKKYEPPKIPFVLS